MGKLRQRVITGLLFGAALLVPLLVGVFPALLILGVLALVTSFEYLGLRNSTKASRWASLLLGAVVYVSFASYSMEPGSASALKFAIYLTCAFAIYLSVGFVYNWAPLTMRFYRVLYPLYTVFPFCLLFAYAHWFGSYDAFIILAILGFVWANDVMAYFVGSLIGRRKLAPSVSPGKTWEGTVGGWIASALIAFVMAPHALHFDSLQLVGMGLLIGVSGTLGDLIESQFKRGIKIKDSGSILPGHGGFLDRLDSLLFCVPLVGLYLLLIKPL